MGLFSTGKPPTPATARASSTQRSAPKPPPSATSGGTTVQEAAAARRLATTITETHGLAGQAVTMLSDLAMPREGEGPTQIEELVQAMATVAESQARLEEKLDRLLRALQPRPV